jgi:uncharacterized protein YndB with AHSA1/START domain
MGKMILIVFIILVAAVGGFAGAVALQPADFRMARSATIAAPPADVFAQVNDFHNWEAWSPWAKKDPAAKTTFEGPSAGTGAIFKWSGNNEVGEGSMTITESKPNELIRIKLDFVKPFEATQTAEFTFRPEGDQTVVTWSMYGQKEFMMRAICLVMGAEKMIGSDFEKGLASMKSVAEAKKGDGK